MMKFRKLILLTLSLSLIFGSVAYADSVSQKLKVWINKKESDSSITVDNKTYISSQIVSDKLQAILLQDDKKISIFKPNVHMVTSYDTTIFADVKKNEKAKFMAFIQVDSLKVDINAYKLTIADPYGDETQIISVKSGDSEFPDGKSDFWTTIKDISYKFDSVGTYTLRFWMKPVGESDFQVVSEKTIASK
ncbi:copper amine oxidase [Cohnella sp. WQ 127256]|uniref:copper amine oxidase n=1 Tax=Cohnella sp. WQ 127256 TaxID=2938790 RepID=UPI002117586D|nr:copper amine oxidase [Cohnella sp. WQ 127256]